VDAADESGGGGDVVGGSGVVVVVTAGVMGMTPSLLVAAGNDASAAVSCTMPKLMPYYVVRAQTNRVSNCVCCLRERE
jgi:hypothetical protein